MEKIKLLQFKNNKLIKQVEFNDYNSAMDAVDSEEFLIDYPYNTEMHFIDENNETIEVQDI